MDRRSFLKGGILAGSAAGLALAGCAPSGQPAPTATPSTGQPSGDAPQGSGFPSNELFEGLEPPAGEIAYVADPIPDDQIVEVIDTDVVICGAGWSGCCAAAAAAEGGAGVVLLQKEGIPNCNGLQVGAFGDSVHEHYGEVHDPEAYITALMYTANFRADENVIRRFVSRSGEAIDWLMGFLGDKIQYPTLTQEHFSVRGGINWYSSAVTFAEMCSGLLPMLIEYAQSFGKTEVYYNTPACQLIQDDSGAIVGVIAKNPEGDYVRLNASKGVILATGGYEFNWEKLKRCMRPRDLEVRQWMNACMGNTGDGHEMALAVGAMEDEYPHCLCADPSGTKNGGAFGAALHSFLRVNDYGLRFINETIPVNFRANAINTQIGAHDWVIVDSNLAANIDKIRDEVIPGTTVEEEAQSFINDSVTSDTLEGLAEQMGVDPTQFAATVKRYNSFIEAGEDADFHTPIEKMAAVVTPPFYACDEGQINLATESGIIVNSDAAVINRETKRPIQGLYAIGTCAGSMFHDTYPHHCSGISLGRGLTYGMIAGRILSGAEQPINL